MKIFFFQETDSVNEEGSDSDFGDWDQDNWGNSNKMAAEAKNTKSSAVRDSLNFHIKQSEVEGFNFDTFFSLGHHLASKQTFISPGH